VTVQPDDVLLNITGASIGRVTTAPPEMAGARVNQHVAIIRPTKELGAQFLANFLASPAIQRMIDNVQVGATREALTKGMIEKFQIPLPPVAEQKRIVAKVDELMALCDRLDALQQERETRHAALARAALARFADAPTLANLDLLFHKSYSIPPADLRKSILTLAVQGLLAPHDEQTWATRKLKDLTTKIGSGSTPSGGKEAYQASGVPLIRSMNVHFGSFVRDGLAFLNEKQAEKLKNVAVKQNDVLLNITGASIGRVTTAPSDMEGARVNQHVCIVRPTLQILPRFLETFLASPVVQGLIDDVQVGATREALTKAMIEQFEIPVPSLAEQRRVVAKVDELMALVDALETQLATARTAGAALLEAAIHELLIPTAEIIRFPSSERESLPDRAAIGCYAIQRLADKRTFGRTAEVKVLYLAEAHLGLDLGGRYLRDAAGPLDQWIYRFEEDAARLQWFSVVEGQTKDGHKKIEYRAGPELAAKAQEASTRLSAAQRREFDRLLGLLAQKPTVEVEAIATLFAAWNDFLLDGRQPSDDEIVREMRENWHPSKQRFKEPELKTWLAWLRQHALVPQGRGPHTVGQQGRLQLH
jgi:type I restriction enzyme S subunit